MQFLENRIMNTILNYVFELAFESVSPNSSSLENKKALR